MFLPQSGKRSSYQTVCAKRLRLVAEVGFGSGETVKVCSVSGFGSRKTVCAKQKRLVAFLVSVQGNQFAPNKKGL